MSIEFDKTLTRIAEATAGAIDGRSTATDDQKHLASLYQQYRTPARSFGDAGIMARIEFMREILGKSLPDLKPIVANVIESHLDDWDSESRCAPQRDRMAEAILEAIEQEWK